MRKETLLFECTVKGCEYPPTEMIGNLRKHRWAAHGITKNGKKSTKKAAKPKKKSSGPGKIPVLVHYCYNCGSPQPKEIQF